MKRKIAIIFITAALLLSMPLTLLAWGFGLPAQYGDTFMGELNSKVALLERTGGPRIVLVGGSALAFGVDSALMERELEGCHVVNFGLYAALGTTVMLDLSQPLIREGDVIILIPEQQEQAMSDWFDPAVMWQGLDGAYGLIASLPGEKLSRLAGAFPEFAGRKLAAFLQGGLPEIQSVYRRGSFNEKGDVASPLCVQNVMPEGYDASTPIRFETDMVTEGFVRRVRTYARAVEEKGAVLWYGFCPMNSLAAQGTAEDMDNFFTSLQEELGVPLAGDPHDFLLAGEWFYDTNFHPNSSGKTVYTRALIRSIKAMLGDSSPTEIALPAMPEMAGAEEWDGDDGDGACFTYEEGAGTLTVTGLTQEGRGRAALTVPSAWEGQPVSAIGPNAFSGAKGLKQIVIQPNIATIADGAFSGCEELDRIVMESPAPSACRVGQGLLSGTQARIYVPEDSLSAYRTDYFWSAHAASISPRGSPETS